MTRPVPESLAEPSCLEHATSGGVTDVVCDARLDRRDGRACASRTASCNDGLPPRRPTTPVRVKSPQYPSKTPPKSSTTRSPSREPRSRPDGAAGCALAGPRRHDCGEGRAACTRPAAAPHRCRARSPARSGRRHPSPGARARPPTSPPQRPRADALQLERVFDLRALLDPLVRGDEGDGGHRAPPASSVATVDGLRLVRARRQPDSAFATPRVSYRSVRGRPSSPRQSQAAARAARSRALARAMRPGPVEAGCRRARQADSSANPTGGCRRWRAAGRRAGRR